MCENNLHNYQFYSAFTSPFKIYGLIPPSESDPTPRRMPKAVAETVSRNVGLFSAYTSGGRIHFSTDADRICIKAKISGRREAYEVQTLISYSGIDLYTCDPFGDLRYERTFGYGPGKDPMASEQGLEVELAHGGVLNDYVLYLPLYAAVYELSIGFPRGSRPNPPRYTYRNDSPVVYYGSSITHGASATRPGITYASIISRRYHLDFTNLGFAGSALAEDAMIEYLASMPEPAVFVCDYDFNAPTVEHYAETHPKLYRAMREAHPDLPILIVTAPVKSVSVRLGYRQIAMKTYLDAANAGDKRVFFLDGASMMADARTEDALIDGVHPCDLGIRRMAYAIGNAVDDLMRAFDRYDR